MGGMQEGRRKEFRKMAAHKMTVWQEVLLVVEHGRDQTRQPTMKQLLDYSHLHYLGRDILQSQQVGESWFLVQPEVLVGVLLLPIETSRSLEELAEHMVLFGESQNQYQPWEEFY
jgi:hypothetical protein